VQKVVILQLSMCAHGPDSLCSLLPGVACFSFLWSASRSRVQRDIRIETCTAFNDPNSSVGAWPSPEHNRDMAARHLNNKLKFPGGLAEARVALSSKVLAPCDPKLNEGRRFRPEMLSTILRRGISRFHRAVLETASAGFMERAASHLSIGYTGDKDELKYSKTDAQRCLQGHWLFETEFGRDAMLWGLYRALARMRVLREHMGDATATKGRYYKVRYGKYVAIVTKVCCMSHLHRVGICASCATRLLWSARIVCGN